MIFCTLFDSNYLDKGLMMFRSLLDTGCVFKMYILAMDEKCQYILENYQYSNLTVINLDIFILETGLQDAQKNRSRAEFCWTCTSFLIDYVLNKFHEINCTYIDADMCFYKNPKCLIGEMENKSVQIIEHRFANNPIGRLGLASSGKYCVEFNTFKNNEEAMKLLGQWKKQCALSCSSDSANGIFGDQGYLENWGENPNVAIVKNLGAGVAPWNIGRYKLVSAKERDIVLKDKKSKMEFELVFFHFHNLNYFDKNKVNICVYDYGFADDELVKKIYVPYLLELDKIKGELKLKYHFYPLIKCHPAFKERKKISLFNQFKGVSISLIDKIYIITIGRIIKKVLSRKNMISFYNE